MTYEQKQRKITYNSRQTAVLDLLSELDGLVREKTSAHIGDLGYVETKLSQLVDFLGGYDD